MTDSELLATLIPMIILQLALMITALVLLVKSDRVRGPKWVWTLIIVFGSLLGSIAFFLFGRRSY
ncbi:PLD nuclease N-terminal domain-containing protein [Cohnella sp. GCM10027633]|uniref:PLD nuclease N-terminal domain-containing protein n=1 Tax=unclassified Cohnella TaxID=2636738 RepID=UPI00362F50DD